VAQRLGYPADRFQVFSLRDGNPVPGLTCEMLTAPTLTYPRGASTEAVLAVKFFRKFEPLECVTYSLVWRDLSIHPDRRL
jgi:hypothetical protein